MILRRNRPPGKLVTVPSISNVPASIAELDDRIERNRDEYLHVCCDGRSRIVAAEARRMCDHSNRD
jgi:hypothetical protein